MADLPSTPPTRDCEVCGSTFEKNPKYSRGQWEKSRFCSKRCAGRSIERDEIPLAVLLGGRTRFGRLTVLGDGEPLITKAHPLRRALCKCDCGNTALVQPGKLKARGNQSCGCLAAELARARFTTHDAYSTPEYKSWHGMLQRCHNEKSTSWDRYGGRGITVCDEWHGPDGFHRFVDHVGLRPLGTSIDRIDGTKGYEPGNVRWATPEVQQNNMACNVILEHNGIKKTQVQWSRHLGLSKNGVSQRLRLGWSIERALSTIRKSA